MVEPTYKGEAIRRGEALTNLVGKTVAVAVSTHGVERDGYHTQMSIRGTLEVHPDDDDAFRVVIDRDIYVYFRSADVYLVNPLTKHFPTINVRVDTPTEKDL